MERGWEHDIFILPMMLITVVGMIVLLNVHNSVNVRYRALFLVVMGEYAAAPIVVCWFSANRESMSSVLPFLPSDTPFSKWVGT